MEAENNEDKSVKKIVLSSFNNLGKTQFPFGTQIHEEFSNVALRNCILKFICTK